MDAFGSPGIKGIKYVKLLCDKRVKVLLTYLSQREGFHGADYNVYCKILGVS